MELIPASIMRSATSCAAEAGVAMIPMAIWCSAAIWPSSLM
jgi:hypothetical protein